MKVTTLAGTVENGQIRLPDNVRLPEKATVYVVIPGLELSAGAYLASPRLVHPEQAADFTKTVVKEPRDAGGIGTIYSKECPACPPGL